jgi:hypothetical protein
MHSRYVFSVAQISGCSKPSFQRICNTGGSALTSSKALCVGVLGAGKLLKAHKKNSQSLPGEMKDQLRDIAQKKLQVGGELATVSLFCCNRRASN